MIYNGFMANYRNTRNQIINVMQWFHGKLQKYTESNNKCYAMVSWQIPAPSLLSTKQILPILAGYPQLPKLKEYPNCKSRIFRRGEGNRVHRVQKRWDFCRRRERIKRIKGEVEALLRASCWKNAKKYSLGIKLHVDAQIRVNPDPGTIPK